MKLKPYSEYECFKIKVQVFDGENCIASYVTDLADDKLRVSFAQRMQDCYAQGLRIVTFAIRIRKHQGPMAEAFRRAMA